MKSGTNTKANEMTRAGSYVDTIVTRKVHSVIVHENKKRNLRVLSCSVVRLFFSAVEDHGLKESEQNMIDATHRTSREMGHLFEAMDMNEGQEFRYYAMMSGSVFFFWRISNRWN